MKTLYHTIKSHGYHKEKGIGGAWLKPNGKKASCAALSKILKDYKEGVREKVLKRIEHENQSSL